MTETALRVAVLTVSDRASAGVYEDHSGPALKEALSQHLACEIVSTDVIPDDKEQIAARLRAWCDGTDVDLILTTGGTGVAPRDITPEATLNVVDRQVPGLAEAMRAASRTITPYGMLSRGVVGIRGKTLIINLPGSPKGAVENLRVCLPILPHAVALLREDTGDHASHHFHHHVTA
jgi:molybdenum cofactor synthesis domain-containing protein